MQAALLKQQQGRSSLCAHHQKGGVATRYAAQRLLVASRFASLCRPPRLSRRLARVRVSAVHMYCCSLFHHSCSPHPPLPMPLLCAQAAADSAALQPPAGDSGVPISSSSSGPPPSTRDAVYLKFPLAGGVQEFPGRSVVVLGDVPSGAVLRAGGDIIVLGR